MLARGRARRDDDAMTPAVTAPPRERRQKRSNDPLVALHHQLTQARRDGGLEAIVVADDAGLVVAGVGAWAICEELAAYAPILVRAGSAVGGAAQDATDGEAPVARPNRHCGRWAEVVVRPVEVEGQTVLLCARVAGDEAARGAALDAAADGVARILRAAA
jgi:hypothetical protein